MNSEQNNEPTLVDGDLMRFFDGELEDDELAEMEALLATDDAQAKLEGLSLGRDIVRDVVNEDSRADGIADAVMAKLQAARDEAVIVPKSLPLKDRSLPLKETPVGAPANDNSRTLWTFAGMAAAVAAGLFMWGNTAPESDPMTARAPAPIQHTAAEVVAPAPETLEDATGPEGPQVPGNSDGEDEDAVEIAQLDFGAHSGSIFKVDNDSTGVHTAVVWVNDSRDDE